MMTTILTLLSIIIVCIIFLISLKRINNNNNKQIQYINTFLNSDEYKNSEYVIEKINDSYYVLKHKPTNKYVDLNFCSIRWTMKDGFFKDCKGTITECIKAFKYNNPTIEVITSIKSL